MAAVRSRLKRALPRKLKRAFKVDVRVLAIRTLDYGRHTFPSRLHSRIPGLQHRLLPLYYFTAHKNFGDAISPILLNWISDSKPVWVPATYAGKVIAVGSNHTLIRQGDVIWGTGAMWEEQIHLPRGTTVLAVRGPLTRALIRGDVPEVYGDPALLLPHIYTGTFKPQWRVGVVPHYTDKNLISISDPAVKIIDVQTHWQQVVDHITACEVIVSSSLHGLIIAEAYRIPAVWTQIGTSVIGAELKFNDHFLATGRDVRAPHPWGEGLSSLVSAAKMPPEFDTGALIEAWQQYESTLVS